MVDTIDYVYGDTNWGDLLTKYDGQSITYDNIGNPTSYYNGTRWSMTWEHGRELTTISNGSTTWTNTYNADGLRTKRTNGTTTYEYIYLGDKLIQMHVGDDVLKFGYDASGSPMYLQFNNSRYFYATNVQGDVTALVHTSGTAVVEYTYDAWGNILTTTGSMASTLGVINPLRYRGYVYDVETKLYYLQSRYYDPSVGRFINADALVSTGQGILGNNMFAYCRNNPIGRKDISGTEDTVAYSDEKLLSEDDLTQDATSGGGGKPLSFGFSSFAKLKNFLGSAGQGRHWHHIVEQSQIAKSGFSAEQIHNTSNIISIDQGIHAQITGHFNSTRFDFTGGISVRNWLAGQPYAVQFKYGMNVLRGFGVIE